MCAIEPNQSLVQRRSRRALAALLGTRLPLLAALLLLCAAVHAHPIVSTDVNRHVTLAVSDDRVEIRYVYEMLEIAAIDAARTWDVDGDGLTAPAERDLFVASWSAELARDLLVELDGAACPLSVASTRWELGEGAFGLKTWKIVARLTGRLPVGRELGELEYRDLLRPDEVGWKEIVLVTRGGTGVAHASVPSQDRSYELTDYAAMADLPNPNLTSAVALLRFPRAVVPEQAVAAAAERAAPAEPATAPPSPPASIRSAPQRPAAAPAAEVAGASAVAVAPSVSPRDAAPAPAAMQTAWAHYAWPFFALGMHHIATGFDHMLFLLGLLLFRQSLGRLAAVITCFTLAHSVTLAASAAGWVSPPGRAIELLIAASIAYVGAASLLAPRSSHGPWIALGFGLVHGFGFAGALQQALGGVSGDRGWLIALASFNHGIEALQLLAVAVAWPLLRYVDRLKSSVALRRVLSCVVLNAGVVWLAVRVMR
jgi:hypothetical protein